MTITSIDFNSPEHIDYNETLRRLDEFIQEWMDHVETNPTQGYNFNLERLPGPVYRAIPNCGVSHDQFARLMLHYLFTVEHVYTGNSVERMLKFIQIDKHLTLKQQISLLQLIREI